MPHGSTYGDAVTTENFPSGKMACRRLHENSKFVIVLYDGFGRLVGRWAMSRGGLSKDGATARHEDSGRVYLRMKANQECETMSKG